MAEPEDEHERPCLHCMMVELIDDFFAEYPPAPGWSDKVGTEEADEVIEAIAKTVAELTPRQDGIFSAVARARIDIVKRLMRTARLANGSSHSRHDCLLQRSPYPNVERAAPGYVGQAGGGFAREKRQNEIARTHLHCCRTSVSAQMRLTR